MSDNLQFKTKEVPNFHDPVPQEADAPYLTDYRDAQESLYRKGGKGRAKENKENAQREAERLKTHDERERQKIEEAKKSSVRPTVEDIVTKVLNDK